MNYKMVAIYNSDDVLDRKIYCPEDEIEAQLSEGEYTKDLDPTEDGFGITGE